MKEGWYDCRGCIYFQPKRISKLVGGYCLEGYYVDYFVETLNGVPISLSDCKYTPRTKDNLIMLELQMAHKSFLWDGKEKNGENIRESKILEMVKGYEL